MKKEIDIEYKGVLITVSGDFTPEEREIMYYKDGTGYPGYSAEFLVEKIMFDGTDVTELYESMERVDAISELVLKCINDLTPEP